MPRVFCQAVFFAAIVAPAAYAQTFKVVYSETPPVWFEAHTVSAVVAPNGTTALLPSRWPAGIRVIDIATGISRELPNFGLDQVRNAVFTHNGDFALWGRLGSQPYAWYSSRSSNPTPLNLPAG